MAHAKVHKQETVREKYHRCLNEIISSDNDLSTMAKDNVCQEIIRKSCNIRIQEFLSSQQQKIASDSGHASTKGQNLCDSLLTQHTQLQSRVKL